MHLRFGTIKDFGLVSGVRLSGKRLVPRIIRSDGDVKIFARVEPKWRHDKSNNGGAGVDYLAGGLSVIS